MALRFEIANVWTKVEGDAKDREMLHSTLAVRAPNYFHSTAYRRRQWDGYTRFYQPGRQCFPTGLLPEAIQRCTDRQVKTEVIDARHPQTIPAIDMAQTVAGLTLFPDQDQAVQAALKAMYCHVWFPRGVIQSPTGTGKTVILADLCAKIRGTVAVFVHTKELLYQTQRELMKMLEHPVGLIGDGEMSPARVTVCMIQTLSLNAKGAEDFLRSTQALLLDECHHYGQAKTYMKLLSQCPASVRIGVSATPRKKGNDEQWFRLMGHTGPLLHQGKPVDFIEEGRLAPVTVRYIPMRTPTVVTLPGSSPMAMEQTRWPDCYEIGIVRNPLRNQLVINLARASADAGKLTLVLCSRIEQGEDLALGLGAVPFLSGKETTAYRKMVLDMYSTGVEKVIVATTIFDEGVDIPDIEHLILAGGGKSELQTLQRIGRGMRHRPGKHLLVSDFFDHQHPILKRHSRERMKACQAAGYAIET